MIGIYYNTGSEAKSRRLAESYQVFTAAYKLIIMQINRTYGISVFLSAALGDLDLRTKPCYLICALIFLRAASANELLRVCVALFLYSFLSRRNIWRIKKAVSCSFYSAAFYPLHHLSFSTLARAFARREKQLGENLQHFISGGSAAEPLSAAERARRERREREMTICTSYFTLFNETWGNYRADTAPNTYMCIRSHALFLL